jgi:glycine/D-amino acid oxidase-like deaminating enzyme
MSKRFDVVIVGGGLSAVLTAALLAKRGLRGLLVDQGELASLGSDHPHDEVWTPSGSVVMERALHELELEHTLTRSWVPEETLLHMIFPDDRVDLVRDDETNARALSRALGADTGGLLASLRDVHDRVGAFLDDGPELPPPSGFFARRSAAAQAKRAPVLTARWAEAAETAGANAWQADFVAGLSPFLTHFDPRSPDELWVGRLARPLIRFFAGVGTVRHDEGLRGMLLDLAQAKALQVRKTAVERIETEGKGWSVRLAGARDPVLADALVDASVDLSGAEVIPSKQQGRNLPLLLQSARPRGYLYAYGLEVDRIVLPPGLGRRMLLLNGRRDSSRFDPTQPNSEDRPIWLILRPGATSDRIQLVALHPFSSVQAHGAEAMATKDAIVRARIERLFPFLPEGHPEPFMPGASEQGPPFLSHPHFDPMLDELTGLGGVPTRSPLKHLFFAGPAVVPGLGQEGEYLAALQAADAVEGALTGGKKKGLGVEV